MTRPGEIPIRMFGGSPLGGSRSNAEGAPLVVSSDPCGNCGQTLSEAPDGSLGHDLGPVECWPALGDLSPHAERARGN